MKNVLVICITVILAFSLGFFTGYVTFDGESRVGEESGAIPPPPSAEEGTAITEEASENFELKENSLTLLKENIENEIAGYDGSWSVYAEDLESGERISVNNKKMVAASLIKLFIMAKVYEEIEKGTILEEDVSADLYNMITVSDNEASNRLVAILGGGTYTDMYGEAFQAGLSEVNGYAMRVGFTDTEQQRDMKNSRPNPISEENYTSVADCGKLLGDIYRGEAVSKEASEKMMELLKKQTRRWKIPAGLPGGVECANKTGELSNVENDVAVVFSPAGDYVLCIMSNDLTASGQAQANIVKISEMVYSYFQNEVSE